MVGLGASQLGFNPTATHVPCIIEPPLEKDLFQYCNATSWLRCCKSLGQALQQEFEFADDVDLHSLHSTSPFQMPGRTDTLHLVAVSRRRCWPWSVKGVEGVHLETCFSGEACHSLQLWKVHFKKTIEELWQAEWNWMMVRVNWVLYLWTCLNVVGISCRKPCCHWIMLSHMLYELTSAWCLMVEIGILDPNLERKTLPIGYSGGILTEYRSHLTAHSFQLGCVGRAWVLKLWIHVTCGSKFFQWSL